MCEWGLVPESVIEKKLVSKMESRTGVVGRKNEEGIQGIGGDILKGGTMGSELFSQPDIYRRWVCLNITRIFEMKANEGDDKKIVRCKKSSPMLPHFGFRFGDCETLSTPTDARASTFHFIPAPWLTLKNVEKLAVIATYFLPSIRIH